MTQAQTYQCRSPGCKRLCVGWLCRVHERADAKAPGSEVMRGILIEAGGEVFYSKEASLGNRA
jgi:hypothetical protein